MKMSALEEGEDLDSFYLVVKDTIAIAVHRANINDNFLSREYNCAPLDYVNKKWILGKS
jgi:hypothetical protein